MIFKLIDTHCHIDFSDFDQDRDRVIQLATEARVSDIIVPAVTCETWQRTSNICAQYEQCHLALGLHPIFINEHQPQHLSALTNEIQKHSPIAVGEILSLIHI